MSGLNQRAKDLLARVDEERREWREERGGTSLEVFTDSTVLYGDDEAIEIIADAAGLHSEYAVEFKNERSGKWHICGFYGHGLHGQQWFASREEAEQQITRSYPAKLVEPRPYRIIRRLVSDEEIIG